MTKEHYLIIGVAGLITGLIISLSIYQTDNELVSPLPADFTVRADYSTGSSPANDKVVESENVVQLPTELPVESFAMVTAYTCDPTMTEEQIAMNCPSLKYAPKGETATGTTPEHKKTVACDSSLLGKQFMIEGVGVVTCEDVGGAIKGEARFDLFFDTYIEAMNWGEKHQVKYWEV